MKYIAVTYDAILSFSQDRFFQSIEFEKCLDLCGLLTGVNKDWLDENIGVYFTNDGILLSTQKMERERVLLFDLTSFNGFTVEKNDNRKISAIFQKSIRYAVKYFESLPLSQNEVFLKESTLTLVYPYPFIRAREVPKLVIDRNSTKEAQRKKLNYLTVFRYETEDQGAFNKTIVERVIKELSSFNKENLKYKNNNPAKGISYSVTDLSQLELSVSSKIGFSNWLSYLTKNQLNFIKRDISGPERLEGAAGTGKTLTMALRIINVLMNNEKAGIPYNIVFFTHSSSTKEMIIDILRNNCQNFDRFIETSESRPVQSVLVTTLQEWCARHLGINDLQENEYLDKDAENSKVAQLLYIETAWDEEYRQYWDVFKNSFSRQFKKFVEETSKTVLFELLQREFSEVIKGQSKSDLEKYLQIDRPKYAIKLINEVDKRFVFQVFSLYQESLAKVGQFDSDDIVISALGQVDSPIWNRRREREGYDACFIDESHLFNLNEISVFHFVNKTSKRNNIIFAIDRTQSLGDYGNRADLQISIDAQGKQIEEVTDQYSTIFRSSIDIINLAYSVLTSGASLFTTLENPLESSNNTFTSNDERKCEKPHYSLCLNSEEMISESFKWAHIYTNKTSLPRNSILFIATDYEIQHKLEKYASDHNKPYVTLKSRADLINMRRAINDNKYVISGIDYVGGLEFSAVIIIGVDKSRVPPKTINQGSHIINYAWYNRMYIALTRAKYAVRLYGEYSSGFSSLFKTSIEHKLITTDDNEK